ncbi:hypothetical protein BTH95_02895 [Lactobacillus delbrueckii subsp. bulgaricus]|uniref:hypothetical protein n=1 Tax=Lactobacillus delbrueckii TaxID=1584 RepID=UPI001BFF78B7|nr:hypothetical protein [Lactobacillus delbrueckii]MBT8804744.1 hypothetical protein [Lactobacillus delbrueckii subsp. bulgaricus]MBT8818724.1 hypothetical protein [Lactobacillus delbrueckii subsp. bulgaricus]MBT8820354.1 hypothetical protein [Lactobacillus delbrueckii subsp. bulgaricus]MBT8821998.1 hypothetical protein [Lactobacillus delbrueckii subsp. bulgaricus]MBT8823111.1 hypothetical protein [Lactobacillus delbrueckii subsp. bulgaricus]
MKIAQYLKSQGIRVPEILKDERDVQKDDIYSHSREIYQELISLSNVEKMLNFVKDEIVPLLLDFYLKRADPSKKLYLQSDLLNFSCLFTRDRILSNEFKKVVEQQYLYDTEFLENLINGVRLGLIDIASYEGKTDEGQAIYVCDLDQTFISIKSNNSYWSLLSFVHEVGHANYNFINKEEMLTVSSQIASELSAYNAELDFILSLTDIDVQENYLFFYLSQVLLYAYSVQMTKMIMIKEEVSPNAIYDLEKDYMPWVDGHYSQEWALEQVDLQSLKYLLARLSALYLHRSQVIKTGIRIENWEKIEYDRIKQLLEKT